MPTLPILQSVSLSYGLSAPTTEKKNKHGRSTSKDHHSGEQKTSTFSHRLLRNSVREIDDILSTVHDPCQRCPPPPRRSTHEEPSPAAAGLPLIRPPSMPLGDLIKKKLHIGVAHDAGTPPKPSLPPDAPDVPAPFGSSPQRKRSVPLKDLEDLLSDQLSCLDDDDDVFVSSGSNLSLSLSDVLGNPGNGAIAYFVQYLEARDASNLLKFWLDVEGFKSAFAANNASHPVGKVLDARDFESYRSISNPQSPQPPSDEAEDDDGPHGPQQRQCGSTESFDSGFADKSSCIAANHIGEGWAGVNGGPEDEEARPRPPLQQQQGGTSRSKDAVEIYQRYIAPDCPYPVPLSKEITQGIVQGICTETGDLDTSCFNLAQAHVVKSLESEYFPDFLRSEGYAKHQLDVLTSGEVQMRDVLYNDSLLFHFMEFMEGEGDRDLLEFWMAASNFRRNREKQFLQSDALIIYEKFVSMQASSSLGVSDSLRSRVEESICSEAGIRSSCFDPLLSLVVRVLQIKYLNLFLNSGLFRKYLSELLCQIQTTSPYAPSGSKDKQRGGGGGRMMRRSNSNTSLSTCSSSDVSISTHNTLLAMSRSRSDAHGRVLKGINEDRAMLSLDALDPDSIWKRKRHSMVNFGQVDNLGRYHSSFEHLPPNPSEATVGSKLTKAMRRLVSHDIGQVQEEMAWQMAEMMVKDVLDVTTGGGRHSSSPSNV